MFINFTNTSEINTPIVHKYRRTQNTTYTYSTHQNSSLNILSQKSIRGSQEDQACVHVCYSQLKLRHLCLSEGQMWAKRMRFGRSKSI